MRLTARGGRSTEIALWALAAIGTITFAAYLVDIILRDGGIAYDLHAYILAGRHALEGAPLYAAVQIGDPGAYRYAPTFAYLAIPLALPPELVVTWVYRAACVVCVRALVGSWRAVGIALLFWPVQIELDALNVTLPIAVLARMALRGSTAGVAATPATAALKYGTILLAPYLWLREPRRRRALLIGLGVAVLAFGVHAVLRPADWADYVASLGQQSRSVNQAPFAGPQLIVLVPSTLGDFVLRFALCAVLTGHRRLAPLELARVRRRGARGAHPMGRPTGAARRRAADVAGGPGAAVGGRPRRPPRRAAVRRPGSGAERVDRLRARADQDRLRLGVEVERLDRLLASIARLLEAAEWDARERPRRAC